jgi:hypothetical protein
MNLTLSRPIQLLALVGLVAAIGGGAMMILKPQSQPSAAAAPVAELRAAAQARARAEKNAEAAKAAASSPHGSTAATGAKSSTQSAATHAGQKTAKKASTTPATTTPAATTPTPKPTVAANGLPIALAKALRKHPVVVVSLFDPQSQTDAFSYSEAKAGASAAGVGFLGVNLLDDTTAAALTAVLPGGGLLPDPGVLVYSAPGTLAIRLDGFADRDAVAQAAAQARSDRAAATP